MTIFRVFGFLLALALMGCSSGTSQAFELKIKRPEYAGPVMLVCLYPNDLISQVSTLTRNQIVGIRAAAIDRELRGSCDDTQLPVGTVDTGHSRWIQTEDHFWILGRTMRYPNDFIVVVADPGVFSYTYKPPEFRLRFLFTNDGRVYERVD